MMFLAWFVLWVGVSAIFVVIIATVDWLWNEVLPELVGSLNANEFPESEPWTEGELAKLVPTKVEPPNWSDSE